MKISYFSSLIITTGIVFIAACKKESPLTPNQSSNQENYVPGQLLIKFKSGDASGTKALTNALSLIDGEIVESILEHNLSNSGLKNGNEQGKLILVNTQMSTMEAIAKLENKAEIEYAEPNFIYNHNVTSNDTYYTNGSLWGMYGNLTSPVNQYGSGAAEAWAADHIGLGTVYVGIIDEGYMYTHEDLAANAGVNPKEIAGNGIDDDGNGFKDDVYGWDFAGNNNTVFDGVNDDHGTHVAGTIGGKGGNGKGVAGINWNVKLLSAKFLGSNGGTTANAIKAVDYFTNMKIANPGMNLVATNNSWGGGGFSQGLYDAIQRANNQGILFIAAAGNETNNNDSKASYPAAYTNSNIIAVASITSAGALSSFSNYGATTIDLGAPGSGIYSTVPKKSGSRIISGYASYNGTSMATPHVTGAAALYASTHPGATATDIKSAILGSTIPTSSLVGKCSTGGRLNVRGF